jgi:hypothetical protein
MVATPSYDGKIDSRYAVSLLASVQAVRERWNVETRILSGDAFLCHARDCLIQLAVTEDVDVLLWIDADTYWKPEDFVRVIEAPYDFAGGLCRIKKLKPEVTLKQLEGATVDDNGALEVTGIGFGMTKMSKTCFTTLYQRGTPYVMHGEQLHQVFETPIIDDILTGEDFDVCNKWRNAGGTVHALTDVKLGHVSYSFSFDFEGLDDPESIHAPVQP